MTRSSGDKPAEPSSVSTLYAAAWFRPSLLALGAALGGAVSQAAGASGLFVALFAGFGALLGSAVARTPDASPSEPSARSRALKPVESSDRVRVLSVVADSVPDAVVLFSDIGTIQY